MVYSSYTHDDLHKVDVEVHRDWAIDLGFSTLPSVALIQRGRLETVYPGALSENKLRELLEGEGLESAA